MDNLTDTGNLIIFASRRRRRSSGQADLINQSFCVRQFLYGTESGLSIWPGRWLFLHANKRGILATCCCCECK